MSDFAADVTPVILTRDEEANIARTLGQLKWAREVIVVDSGSKDATLTIARGFPNVRVEERTLDADYFVPGTFPRELQELRGDVAGYVAHFHYAIQGRKLRASLYPERAVLLRRDAISFSMDGHTQRVNISGPTADLRTRFIHDDRKPFTRFLERQRAYMRDEAAKIRRGDNLNFAARVRKLRVVAPVAVLLQTLFIKGLILDGVAGLTYAYERFVAELMLSRELFRSSDRP